MSVPALADDTNVEVAGQLQISLQDAVAAVQSLEKAGVLETTGTSLTLGDGVTYEQFEALGRGLGLINRSCQWWVGDWLNYGEGAYGEKFAQAASETGLAEQTLVNRMYVCKHVAPSRRRASLPFSVHAEVAALPAKEQRQWLDRAEKGGWTRADLRSHMKATRKDERPQLHDDDANPEMLIRAARDLIANADFQAENVICRREDVVRLQAALGEGEE